MTAQAATGGPREGAPSRALLVALLPPGSVEARVGSLQRRIFDGTGLASFLALPPMIPISFLGDEPSRESFEMLGRSPRDRYRIVSQEVQWGEEASFLRLHTGGLWEELRAGVAAWKPHADRGQGLFPEREGFFLGCLQGGEPLAPGFHADFSLPPLAFTSATLALVSISTFRENGGWWQEVLWEIIRQMPLRARRVPPS